MDKKKLPMISRESKTALVNVGGLGILDLKDMNKALAVKWIYRFANSKNLLWRKVVFVCSGGNPNSLMPSLENRGNKSVLINFMESAIGRTRRIREVIDQQFRTLIMWDGTRISGMTTTLVEVS